MGNEIVTRKSQTDIFLETVEAFARADRATANGTCQMETAVSRCLTDEGRQRVIVTLSNGVSAAEIDKYIGGGLDTVLQPQYRGHPLEFWVALQSLHDRCVGMWLNVEYAFGWYVARTAGPGRAGSYSHAIRQRLEDIFEAA